MCYANTSILLPSFQSRSSGSLFYSVIRDDVHVQGSDSLSTPVMHCMLLNNVIYVIPLLLCSIRIIIA